MSECTDSFWNQLQALAWIVSRDRVLVSELAENGNQCRTFWQDVRLPDGSIKTVETPAGEPTALLISMKTCKGAIMAYPDAKRELLDKLAAGVLIATGHRNGKGDREQIPALTWVDMDFFESPLHVAPKDYFRVGATRWQEVKFKASDILSTWPPKNASCKEISANWDNWSNMISTPLWQAVALSLDIEPETLRGYNANAGWGKDPFSKCPSAFLQRLKIAVNHAENGMLSTNNYPDRAVFREVRLEDFEAWSKGQGWTLPERLYRSNPQGLPQKAAKQVSNSRGPKPTKRWELAQKLDSELQSGAMQVNYLKSMKEVSGSLEYKVSRDTFRKARNDVLSKYETSTISDK